MTTRLLFFLVAVVSVRAGTFYSGQAARAVLGQSSFSSQDSGIAATSLAISNGKLYAADTSQHVVTFDLSAVPGLKDDMAGRAGVCPVCEVSPVSIVNQSVLPGVAAVSIYGKTVLIADTLNHQVMIWKNVGSPRAGNSPDVVLGPASTLISPISVAFDGAHVFVGDAAQHRVLVWNSIPVSGSQVPDAILGQAGAADALGPDTIVRPDALASDGTNLFVADGPSRRILLFSAGDLSLSANSVVNSASLATGPLAPGTLITINGTSLSDTSKSAPDDGTQAVPKELAGVEVVFDGVALPLLAVDPGELRAQIPYGMGNVSAGSLYIRTEHSDGTITVTNAVAVKLTPASPGIFAFGGSEPRPGMVLHGASGGPVTAESPVHAGEVVTVWATGLGSVNTGDPMIGVLAGIPYDGFDAAVLTPVSALVNGDPAQVISAVLPGGAIGIYEVKIALPAGMQPGVTAQLSLAQNGYVSNTVTFAVANTIP